MIDSIKECTRCHLSSFQKPTLDSRKECDVMWLGLSSKIESDSFSTPLDPETNSGKILSMIEGSLPLVKFYSSNLVKCAPLTEENKLRYPIENEISACFSNLEIERKILHPKIIVLLGEKVTSAINTSLHIKMKKKKVKDFSCTYFTHNQIIYLSVDHPSYIYIYKHKYISEYVKTLSSMISTLV